MHEVGHAEQRPPAQRAARVERRVIVGPETAQVQQRHRERVADRQRGGRRRRGRQIHGTGFLGHAHVEDHLALARERRLGIAGQQHDRYAQSLERRQDGEHLVGLARVRQRQHHVPARHHAEIAVNAFGRMEEKRRRAGRGQRGGDLPPHETGLAHPGDDDATDARVECLHGPIEPLVELGDETEDRFRLDAQHALGKTAVIAAGSVHGSPSPARIASSWSSNRGRSSMRSMFGPSESGRPSGSVRSGSSCISMKSASTPKATAARANPCT